MGCKQSTAAGKGGDLPKALPTPEKPTVVFVLGGPGAGKGTQCGNITRDYGFVHLSAGDLLRAERNSGSDNATLINQYITDGKIVPVEITVGLIKVAMEKSAADGKMYFLVDGFPRNQDNLDGWYKVMGDYADVAFVLAFECSEAVMEERLLERGKTSGRADDNAESIRKRFRTFQEESVPVINIFEKEGKVRRMNAEQTKEEVYADVQKVFAAEIEKRTAAAAAAPAEEKKDDAAGPGEQVTFAWIKPDVVALGKDEEMLAKIKEAGFEVVAQRKFTPGKELAEEFYAEHKGKPFFDGLVEFMSGSDAIALALKRDNAILQWRATLGPTNSNKAREEAPESLRAQFGTDGSKNAGHGSDSVESAARELKLVFPDKDFGNGPGVQVTFAWIKPDVVAAGKDEEMLAKIKEAGFEVAAQRRFTPGKELAEEFYAEHKGKPFFDGLVEFMSGGDAVALALKRDNAILQWRATLGPTNSNKAREEAPESLRAQFGTDGSKNAGHGSDSVESAARELKLVFPDKDF